MGTATRFQSTAFPFNNDSRLIDQYSGMANHPQCQPTSRQTWRAWLQKHHASSSGVWLVFAKKASGLPTVTYNDAVEEALCFGWIDGLMHPVDETFYKQLFTPRKPKSRWAASNKARVEKLIAAGLMTEAGLKTIEVAKQIGTWGALDAVEAMTLPDDFKRALSATPAAKKGYDAYTPSAKKQCLYYLNDAKRPETRAKRIARIVEGAAAGRKPSQS
jgi:uncharacterized protein YdeI (YjbR/CyaY-like superfamily)